MPAPRRPKPVQPNLFAPTPKRPHWANLPPEIRARVLPLLARLLRSAPAAETGKEVGRD